MRNCVDDERKIQWGCNAYKESGCTRLDPSSAHKYYHILPGILIQDSLLCHCSFLPLILCSSQKQYNHVKLICLHWSSWHASSVVCPYMRFCVTVRLCMCVLHACRARIRLGRLCVSLPWHTSLGEANVYSRADSAWLNAPHEPAWMKLTAPMRQGRRNKARVDKGLEGVGRGQAGCVNLPCQETRTLCVAAKGWETRHWPGHSGTLRKRNHCSSIWFWGRFVPLERWETLWQWAWWMSVALPSNICGWLLFLRWQLLGLGGNCWKGEVWFFFYRSDCSQE